MMEENETSSSIMKRLSPTLFLALLTGCSLGGGIEPHRVIHNSRADMPSAPLGEKEAQAAVRVLEARRQQGNVSVDETVRALETLSRWVPEDSDPFIRECAPYIDSVVPLFADPSEDVRFHAVETAGVCGCQRIERELLRTRETGSSALVREAAAESLILLGLGDDVWSE